MKLNKSKYATSKEAMKILKVKSCDLMHMRVSGKLEYIKKGNAYF